MLADLKCESAIAFVVKATGPGGGSAWLSGPRLNGFRTLAVARVLTSSRPSQTRTRDCQHGPSRMRAWFSQSNRLTDSHNQQNTGTLPACLEGSGSAEPIGRFSESPAADPVELVLTGGDKA